MDEEMESGASSEAEGPRNYTFLCITALVGLLLGLIQRGMGGWSLLPVIAGVLGLGLRLSFAPPLLLILVSIMVFNMDPPRIARELLAPPPTRFLLIDWLISASVLAYFAGYYRLQSLTQSLVPGSPARKAERHLGSELRAKQVGKMRAVRHPSVVSPMEIGWLVLMIPIWAALAQLASRILPLDRHDFDLNSPMWRSVTAVWLGVLGVTVISGIISFLTMKSMSRQDAAIALQDTLWNETCREQRKISAWLVWRRKKTGRNT